MRLAERVQVLGARVARPRYETGDEEMAETGKDYQSFFNLDFNFIEVKELF